MQAKSERFEMRLDQGVLDKVDAWRGRQSDLPSRAEAMRRLMEGALASDDPRKVRFSDGEKLILWMLCDLKKSLKVKGEIDPDFIIEVLSSGHYWGLKWKYSGIFHNTEDNEYVVSEVVDILDMWSFLQTGFDALPSSDKLRVKNEVRPLGDRVQFIGFDANNEVEHLSVGRFLTEELDRFPSFKGKVNNSHFPTLNIHRNMYSRFNPLRATLAGRELNVDEIIRIMKRD